MVFARNGYEAASLQLLADMLQISRQALYHYFKSKDQILAALFDDYMSRLEAAESSVGAGSSQFRFQRMVRAHIEVVIADVALTSVLIQERPVMSRIPGLESNRRRARYTESFIDAYRQGVAAGELHDYDARVIVNSILMAANGLSFWYRPFGELKPAQVIDQLTACLTEGFARQDSAGACQ